MKEIWKDIKDFEDYQVSNFGNVKSLKYNKEGNLLKAGLTSGGYLNVILSKDNIKTHYTVHKLVAVHFLNHVPCGMKLVINHKDFNRQNNNVDNLEIVTQRENTNKKHIKTSSNYIGVSWDKSNCKWLSSIRINNKKIHLGRFDNEINASNAYQKKLKEIQSI